MNTYFNAEEIKAIKLSVFYRIDCLKARLSSTNELLEQVEIDSIRSELNSLLIEYTNELKLLEQVYKKLCLKKGFI